MPAELITPQQLFSVRLGPAACAVDIGDGSERGEYVSQDYLLRVLGRPHRSVNLMYTYYPYDQGWPLRASVAFRPTEGFAWAYPYDDYYPYEGGSKGNTDGRPFSEIRDIRRHGQDVTLSLTIDCKTEDAELRVIARELAPFGHLRLRINHECDGSWFAHNKRYTHKQISDFFIRFHNIIKAEAPLVKTICCWGTLDTQTGKLKAFDDLSPMLRYADLWSMDRYITLHYAWPFNVCEEEHRNRGYVDHGVEGVWNEMCKVYEAFANYAGQAKPLEICEFNADGDVPGGPTRQASLLRQFYTRALEERPAFLKGITYYQFRDRGRLGLEQEDPNSREVGVPAPFMADYRKLIQNPYFTPGEQWRPLPAGATPQMHWRHSEDSEGLGCKVKLSGRPSFFELKCPKDANLLIRVAGQWFYKKPGYEWVDATPATAELGSGDEVSVAFFAPPADGGAGTQLTLESPPQLRVRYWQA